MNLFEAQDFFKKMYPGKDIKFEFDENCHRIHEIVYTDGKPNLIHHIENRKVKVSIEGMDSIYVPISPHREGIYWSDLKRLINSKKDVHVNTEDIENIKSLPEKDKEVSIKRLSEVSGLSIEEIRKKVG